MTTYSSHPARDFDPTYLTHDPAAEARRERDYAAGRIAQEQGHPEPKAYGHKGKSEAWRDGWWDARNGRY